MDYNTNYAALFTSINEVKTKKFVNWNDLIELCHNPQEVNKNQASCLAPQLTGAKTKLSALKDNAMSLLWIDIDDGDYSIETIEDQLDPLNCAYIIYSTASSLRLNSKGTLNGQRWRVLIPPSREMPCDEWSLIQQKLSTYIDGDKCNHRISQILYAPNNPQITTGELKRHYKFKINDNEALDIDKLPKLLNPLEPYTYQPSHSEPKNNHRNNITPVVIKDYSYGEYTLKGTSSGIQTAFTEELYQRQILKFLGFKDFDLLFTHRKVKVRSILHEDNSKSGGLLISETGHVIFHDFAHFTKNKHIPLNELYATLINSKLIDLKPFEKNIGDGKTKKIGAVTAAVWSLRLLIESGVIQPYDVELLPPPNNKPNLIKVYNGIQLLFQVRWAYSGRCNEPITMGRKFIAVWCGVSENIARTGIIELLKADVIQTSGKHGRANTYKLGEYTMQCSCGGGMVESSHEVKLLKRAQDWSKKALNKHLPIKVEQTTCKGCGRITATIKSSDGKLIEKRG